MKKIGESWKKTKIWFRKTWMWLINTLENIYPIISIICSLLIIVVCIAAIMSCAAYIQLAADRIEWVFCFRFLNIGNYLSINEITTDYLSANSEKIKESLTFMVNTFVAVSGLLLTLVTAISYFGKVTAAKKKSSFSKIEVFPNEKQDLEIMLSYFKGADYIAVFSQTFSWVKDNDEMINALSDVAYKNRLAIFSPDIALAKANLEKIENDSLKKTILKTLKKLENANRGLRFSYVERDNARYLLYRQEKKGHTYVIVMHENTESMYLLETISQLVRSLEKYGETTKPDN